MKVMFASALYNTFKPEVVEMECVPRVGDNVNMFFNPAPLVEKVVWFPDVKADVLVILK